MPSYGEAMSVGVPTMRRQHPVFCFCFRLARRLGLVVALTLSMWMAPGTGARAGQLSDSEAAAHLPPPLQLGQRLVEVPAWPVLDPRNSSHAPVGYVFESIDIAPVPGFSGHPINLLIAIDAAGRFLQMEVLSQHEPMFVDALGQAPLEGFVQRYLGHNLRQRFSIVPSGGNAAALSDEQHVVLDGISTATVSVRVVNQTVLTSAVAVARARLGSAAPAQQRPALVRTDVFERKTFARLLADGDIAHRRWYNREVEALFASGPGAGLDLEAHAHPDAVFVDIYVAHLNVPTIGKAVLGDAAYQALMRRSSPERHYYWVATAGRYSFTERGFAPRSVPARLSASQDGIPVELRDSDLALVEPDGAPPMNAMLVLASPSQAGLDPGRPLLFGLEVVRERTLTPGLDLTGVPKTTVRQTLNWEYRVAERYLDMPAAVLPEWLESWRNQWPRLGILAAALCLLSAVLLRPRWLSVSSQRLRRFRVAFLLFTLIYIGWYAQGQLSVAQLAAAVQALAAGRGLGSFLYDPVSLMLIAFSAASFFVWGRGTFCGWLCPFGALQELVAMLVRALRWPTQRLPGPLLRGLRPLRHALLVLVLGAAVLAPPAVVDAALEIEPFKTSISLGFVRHWPFVLYALGVVALGAVYYKFFCRFVCPLGAAMTWGGALRVWAWLPRRDACGTPCQSCRYRCHYDAIDRDGSIRYGRCFQCLDCVGIYHDAQRCAPLLLQARKGRIIPVVPAPRQT